MTDIEKEEIRRNPPRVMNSKECAAFLGFSEEHLSRLRKEGLGPTCSQPGRRSVRFLLEDAIAWLRDHQ